MIRRPLEGSATPEAATDIDYDRIGRSLAASALSPSPAEAHGILCGLVCGGDPDPGRLWLEQVLPGTDGACTDLLAADARAALAALSQATLERIRGPGLDLEILLPDDARPLAERAGALYDWVRGFLFAMGLIGVPERDLGAQTREILRDFVDITRMDLDALDEGEDNEVALTEVAEMVRVAAMLVFEERAAARSGSA